MYPILFALLWLLCGPASASTYVVTDAGDAVDATHGDDLCATAGNVCTFRAAVEEANNHTGADVIVFGSGAPYVLAPATLLPDLNGPLTVDALGCSGTCGSTYRLEVQGHEELTRGLLLSNAVTVRGVKITGTFGAPSAAILVGGVGAVMDCMRVDVTATVGINITTGSAQTQLLNSVIDGTLTGDCVGASAAAAVVIQGNTITGCEDGVYLSASSGAILYNSVSGHTHNGIHLDNGTDGVVVYGNDAHDNGQDGLRINDSDATRVGGPWAWMRNMFFLNTLHGVWVRGTSDATHIENNFLGAYPTPTPLACNGQASLRDDGTNTTDTNNVKCPTPTPAPGCCAVTGAASCVSQEIAASMSLPLTNLTECQTILDTALGSGNATAVAFNATALCQGVTTPGTGTCP